MNNYRECPLCHCFYANVIYQQHERECTGIHHHRQPTPPPPLPAPSPSQNVDLIYGPMDVSEPQYDLDEFFPQVGSPGKNMVELAEQLPLGEMPCDDWLTHLCNQLYLPGETFIPPVVYPTLDFGDALSANLSQEEALDWSVDPGQEESIGGKRGLSPTPGPSHESAAKRPNNREGPEPGPNPPGENSPPDGSNTPRPEEGSTSNAPAVEVMADPPIPSYIPEELCKKREFILMVKVGVCPNCQLSFDSRDDLFAHFVNNHWSQVGEGEDPPDLPNPIVLRQTRRLFRGAFRRYDIDFDRYYIGDVAALFQSIRKQYKEIVRELLRERGTRNFKVQFFIRPHFYKKKEDGTEEITKPSFITPQYTVENEKYGNFAFRTGWDYLDVRVSEFLEEKSGWALNMIEDFDMIISESPLTSGGTKTLVPMCIAHKYKEVIDVPEGEDEGKRDDLCFLRCLVASTKMHEIQRTKYNTNNKNWRSKLDYAFYKQRLKQHRFNLKGITFPFNINQCERFEKQTKKFGLNIFVFDEDRTRIDSIEEGEGQMDYVELKRQNEKMSVPERVKMYHQLREHMFTRRICRQKRKKIIDLLLIENGDKSHYILIKDLRKLLQYPNRGTKHICRYCFGCFDKLAKTHERVCPALGLQKVTFPEEDFLHFNSPEKSIRQLYLGTADFESMLKPMHEVCGNSTKIQKHVASSYAWAITKDDGRLAENEATGETKKFSYISKVEGENVAVKMIRELMNEADIVNKKVRELNDIANGNRKEMCEPAPPYNGQKCGFCKKSIQRGKQVRHHDHFPPYKFQFWSCNKCNLKGQTFDKLIVLVHNLRGYDSGFLIKACASLPMSVKVDLIASSMEKVFSIQIGHNLIFRDSMNFIPTSLDTVAKTMNKDTDFVATRQHFEEKFKDDPEELKQEKIDLMLRKGIYPYSYFDCIERYNETELPPREAFYNDLARQECSEEDYEHAKKVWEKLEIKDLREYTLVYNEQDVVILLDAINRLRGIFYDTFGLDPAHFFSLAHLTWQCCLKYTKVELAYLKDPTMYAWYENSVRGGCATGCELRAARANNPLVGNYDDKKPTSFLMAFDLVNLYGASLKSKLPVSHFKWVGPLEMRTIQQNPVDFIKKIDKKNKGKEIEIGYTFEIDAEFPPEIQDKMVGLTPMPYKRRVYYEELSPFQQEFADQLEINEAAMSTKRLITDFHPRRNYIVHYRVLQLYLELGIKLTKVHRAVRFRQSDAISSYIDVLARKRKETKIPFEQNMWKLAANAVFGKSVENVRDRCNFIMIRSREQALRYMKKATVANVHLIDTGDGSDLALLRMRKLAVKLNKPIYMGSTILDEAKRILYHWYYKYAMEKWNKDGKRFYAIASDTDSVYCLIETDNVYDDILEDKHLFDMSGYDQNDELWKKYYDDTNAKVPGLMKDENPNMPMKEIVFLRPKSYEFVLAKAQKDPKATITPNDEKVVMKQKGTPKATIREQVTKSMYEEALERAVQHMLSSTQIVKNNHSIYTMIMLKKGLSGLDMKRYCLNEYLSYPFGYYLISEADFFKPPIQQEEHPNALCTVDPNDPDPYMKKDEPKKNEPKVWSTTQDIPEGYDYSTSASEYDTDFIDDSPSPGPTQHSSQLSTPPIVTPAFSPACSNISASSCPSPAFSNFGSPSVASTPDQDHIRNATPCPSPAYSFGQISPSPSPQFNYYPALSPAFSPDSTTSISRQFDYSPVQAYSPHFGSPSPQPTSFSESRTPGVCPSQILKQQRARARDEEIRNMIAGYALPAAMLNDESDARWCC